MLTLSEIAQLHGEADNLSAEGISGLHTVLRGQSQRGLFHPISQRGKAAEYDMRAVHSVRILMEGSRLGHDQSVLRDASRFLLSPVPQRYEDLGKPSVAHIDYALEHIRAGHPVVFLIELYHSRAEGKFWHRFRFDGFPQPEDGDAEAVMRDWVASQGISVRAKSVINAAELLKPILDKLEG